MASTDFNCLQKCQAACPELREYQKTSSECCKSSEGERQERVSQRERTRVDRKLPQVCQLQGGR